MRIRLTAKGYLGLLVGLAAAAFGLVAGPAGAPAKAQEREETPPPAFVPTEKIDVEQAVAFPYDI
jgi:hypothetical protein